MVNQISKQINFQELKLIIDQRLKELKPDSYTAKLYQQGIDKIAQKVGEEAVEVVIASLLNSQNQNHANQKTKENLINEFCDLFFHSLILLSVNNISLEEIFQEFYRRNQDKK